MIKKEVIYNAKKMTFETVEREFTKEELSLINEQEKEIKKEEIEFNLLQLDKKIPRSIEDLISLGSLTTNDYIDEVIKEKEVLRLQLKELTD